MKNYFVTNMYEMLSLCNLCGYQIYALLPLPVKVVFENLKNLESVVNSFVFCIKVSCQTQSKGSPSLSKQSPSLVQPHSFRKNILSPPLLSNQRKSIPPTPHSVKAEVGTMKKTTRLVLNGQYQIGWNILSKIK